MRLNEDNRSGFHTDTFHTGIDRATTGGNDAPLPVGLGKVRQSTKEAKDILMGKSGNEGGASAGASSAIDSHDTYNFYDDHSVHHSGVADGLAWFGTHFKEIAIVAAASAAILAIAKLIKGANKSIKFRYNKVVKTLQRAQKDFTVNPKGLDMRAVMPGIGSRLNDYLQNFFSGMWNRKNRVTNNNIGLHPFCSNYIEEIERDYATATAAFSKIKLGSENADQDRNTDASVGNVNTSAYSGKIYSSFKEAYSDELLNEGVSPDNLDESVLAAISAGVALTSLAVKAGTFLYQRYKNGKPVGDPKAVQVTAESTREICYAIINNYADKYVNMTQVFKELGIDSKSLADIDKTQVDKLRTILEKYQKPEKNAYTKQYERIEKAYTKMLDHYYKIGDGIITNFVQYSEKIDEKHANLIVASKEKLQNMWDVQKDFYTNNFSHVIVEIISSEAYIKYLDFIINKVLPVFKSGLAGDADYIFDVVPKKGEYYIIRQTGDQPMIQGYEDLKGKSGIAEVVGFDKETKKITFKFVGALKDSNEYNVSDDGIATLDNSNPTGIDYDIYKDKGDIELEYGKWLSIDPIQLDWSPLKYSPIFVKSFDYNGTTYTRYLYGVTSYEKSSDGFDKFVLVTTKRNQRDVVSIEVIDYPSYMSLDDFEHTSNLELKYLEGYASFDDLNYWNTLAKEPDNTEKADTIDNFIEIVNHAKVVGKPTIKAVSKLYSREDDGKIQYAYAVVEGTDESVKNSGAERLNEDDEDPDVVDDDSDAAKKENVRMIMFCCVVPDFDFSSEDVKGFNGAAIVLDKLYSIEDIHKKLIDDGFEGVGSDVDSPKIKSAMNRLIFTKNNVNKKSYTDEFALSNINVAMKEVSKRSDADEQISGKIEKWTQDIMNKAKPFFDGDWRSNFEAKKCPNPYDVNDTNIFSEDKKIFVDRRKTGFAVELNVRLDNGSKLEKMFVIPTAMTKDKKKHTKQLSNDENPAVILFINRNTFTTVPFDEDSIKNGLNKVFTSFIANEKFSGDAEPIEADDSGVVDSFKTKIEKVIGPCLKEVIGAFKDKGDNSSLLKISNPKLTNINVSQNSAGMIVVSFNSIKDLSMKIDPTLPYKMILEYKGNASMEHQIGKWDLGSLEHACSDAIDELTKGTEKENQQSGSESVKITYKTKTSISESTGLNVVNVKRKVSGGKFRNWYVLSEAVYDDGSGYVSKLDNKRVVESMTDRSDFSRFAKTSKLAKFMPFESQQTYVLASDKGYVPSIATPLYESVVLVKFDKMDNVIDKVVIGRNKIV